MAGDKKTHKKISVKRIKNDSTDTVKILERAWNDLPDDFGSNEKILLVEVAERLIRMAKKSEDSVN